MANFYGQFDTDKHIAEYFSSDYVGSAIEVGAAHGEAASNTLYFEQKGWNVLCIEPHPGMFNSLAKRRKHAQNYAISNENKDGIPFQVVSLVNNDVSAISSLKVDDRLLSTHPVTKVETIYVKVRTLDQCIEEANMFSKIDFVSIDTEGTELDVLEGFNLLRWNPKLLVIENNFNDPFIEEYLINFGYEKHKRIVINDFYIKR